MSGSQLLTLLASARTASDVRVFSEADQALAITLVRRAKIEGEQALAIALAVAALSRATQGGHSALELDDLAELMDEVEFQSADSPSARTHFKDRDWWSAQLAVDGVVGASGLTPLVLDDGLLQFRRLYDAEHRIAQRLTTMCSTNHGSFQIITGGPGTGKTTRAANDLVELTAANASMQIALAAPTGKAAKRMSESILHRLDELQAPDVTRQRVPQAAATLHRLLRYHGGTDRFRHGRDNPLAADLVVVDEGSMIGVLLMDALLAALAPHAQLRLVGDHNQLASVEAGDVLGALCRAGLSAASPLHGTITTLERNYRFEAHPAIGEMSRAILNGDGDRAMAVLGDPMLADMTWSPLSAHADAHDLLEPLASHFDRCAKARTPYELLEALNGFRVLAPEHDGELGTKRLNKLIERALRRRGVDVTDQWYHRRAVLVTANDYVTSLYNGDLGVVWEEGGSKVVHFPDGANKTRAVAVSRLPAVDTAWAMTVHKAQGSEFNEVVVVLPSKGSRVLGRELLYTAVTRARQRATIVGTEAVIRQGVAHTTHRRSGLERLLG